MRGRLFRALQGGIPLVVDRDGTQALGESRSRHRDQADEETRPSGPPNPSCLDAVEAVDPYRIRQDRRTLPRKRLHLRPMVRKINLLELLTCGVNNTSLSSEQPPDPETQLWTANEPRRRNRPGM